MQTAGRVQWIAPLEKVDRGPRQARIQAVKGLCHLNGRIVPLADARIHPLDRGFLFGDALYEVMKVRSTRIFELGAHLERLSDTLERTGIGEPAGLVGACEELVDAAGLDTGFLYLQVSRGVAPRTHLPPSGMTPTVFILPAEYVYAPPAGREIRVVAKPDRRWGNCDIKTTSMIATVLAKISAESEGVDEVVFVGEQGEVREGGQNNLFVRRNDTLETHAADRRILPGVTRQLLLRLAEEEGLPLVERAPLLAQRAEWQEAFLCGTLTGVQPVVEVDGLPIGDGRAGAWTERLAAANERYELESLESRDGSTPTAGLPVEA